MSEEVNSVFVEFASGKIATLQNQITNLKERCQNLRKECSTIEIELAEKEASLKEYTEARNAALPKSET